MFETTQRSFAAALLDVEKPVPSALTSRTTQPPAMRFSVYRNNVVASLVNALAARFPATERIVGREFFRAMARVFATGNPPKSPLLMTYGEDFPEFIAGFGPAAELPYLSDVARLEAARTRAYHATDASSVAAEDLRHVDEASLGELRIVPHPSVQIVRSTYPVVTIWGMNAGEFKLRSIEDWASQDALIVRPQLDVLVRMLPAGGATFLETLFAGGTLAEAVMTAQAGNSEFNLAANLAGLIASGVAAACIKASEE